MLERMKKSLDSPEGLEKSRTCNNCFLLGDVFCCQGCFFVFYCSRSCQDTHWAQSHETECKAMSDILVQEAAKMPPDELSGVHRGKHKANIQRIYLLKKKNSELATELNRREEDLKYLEECKDKDARIISDWKVENEELKAQISKLKKEKAGKASAFMKLKRKHEELDSDDEDDEGLDNENVGFKSRGSQTKVSLYPDSNILAVRSDESTGLKYVDVYKGRELELRSDGKRKYGESLFVRLSSSRASLPNIQVSSIAIRERALVARDIISLISGSYNLAPGEASQNDEIIFAYLVRQNPELFKNLLKSNKEVLSAVMKLGPGETAKFMHSSNISYATKRKMSTMFGKIFNFNVFSSEKKQREFENEKKVLVERNKMEHGNLLLYKTATAEYTTLCAFVRVSDLASFVSELYEKAMLEDILDPNSMKNLQHLLYKGKLWVVIGGDKGSKTMKFVCQVGGHDPHIFGIFEASDTPSNLLC